MEKALIELKSQCHQEKLERHDQEMSDLITQNVQDIVKQFSSTSGKKTVKGKKQLHMRYGNRTMTNGSINMKNISQSNTSCDKKIRRLLRYTENGLEKLNENVHTCKRTDT